MFDDLARELKKLENPRTISIQMPLDDEGYLDRVCPTSECASYFKVLWQDWRDKVPDQAAWCAICGRSEQPQLFNTPEQDEYIKSHALRHLQAEVNDVLRRATPRSQEAGIVRMTLTYKPGAPVVIAPYQATAVLDQRSVCERCGQ